MKVEEIALRQEMRQLLNEGGINKNTVHDIAMTVLREEIQKQVKNAINQTNVNAIISKNMGSSYELRMMLQNAIRDEIQKQINMSIDVHLYPNTPKEEASNED